ncbi:MAG: hypothetical protein M1812_006931 [Candelaria pacifica]|nr:MAG: hypothetical protein M1812_006931 [Candelaria pacifica]
MSSRASKPATPPRSVSNTSPSEIEENMYNTLRPIAYIHRGGNVYVPLIAVDELPPGVNVREVPRTVRLNHTGGMTNVGTFTPTGQYYTLEGLENLPVSTRAPQSGASTPTTQPNLVTRRFHAPDAFVNRSAGQTGPTGDAAKGTMVAPNGAVVPINHSPTYNKDTWLRNRQAANVSEQTRLFPMALAPTADAPTTAATTPPRSVNPSQYTGSMALRLLPPSGREPVLENKTYCTFWLRTGCCDYMQQGCKYKHEMPGAAGLVAIGLPPEPPKWWNDRQLHNWRAPANPDARPGEDPTAAFRLPQRALTAPVSPSPAARKVEVKRPLTSEAPTMPITKPSARPIMKPDSPAQRQIDAIIGAPQKPPAEIPGFRTLKPTPALRSQPVTPPQTQSSSTTSQPTSAPAPKSELLAPSKPAQGLAASRYSPGARFIPADEPLPLSTHPAIRPIRKPASPISTPSQSPNTPSSTSASPASPSSHSTKQIRPTPPTTPSKPSSSPRSHKPHRPTAATPPRVAQIKEITSSSEDLEDDEQAEIYPEHKRRSEIPQPRFHLTGVPKNPKGSKIMSKSLPQGNGRSLRPRGYGSGERVGRFAKGKVVYEKMDCTKQRANGRDITKEERNSKVGNGSRQPKRVSSAKKEILVGEMDLDLS